MIPPSSTDARERDPEPDDEETGAAPIATTFTVESRRCIRCGACALMAPDTFERHPFAGWQSIR
jgi:ferredoxin